MTRVAICEDICKPPSRKNTVYEGGQFTKMKVVKRGTIVTCMWGWAIPPNPEFVGIYLDVCTATKSVTQLQDAPFVASIAVLSENFECKV